MPALIIISALTGVIALVFFVHALRCLFKHRLAGGAGRAIVAVTFLGVAVVSLLLASNLYTYQRLVYEQPVAELHFIKLMPQQYRVDITTLDNGRSRQFVLQGDEWQLDAQVLLWKGFANLLGLDAEYRLHRLSGRYLDLEKARYLSHSVYSLLPPQALDGGVTGWWNRSRRALDIWNLAHRYANFSGFVDAIFGSAVFLPMADGATYQVSLSRTGLVARPVNMIARKAVNHWIGL